MNPTSDPIQLSQSELRAIFHVAIRRALTARGVTRRLSPEGDYVIRFEAQPSGMLGVIVGDLHGGEDYARVVASGWAEALTRLLFVIS